MISWYILSGLIVLKLSKELISSPFPSWNILLSQFQLSIVLNENLLASNKNSQLLHHLIELFSFQERFPEWYLDIFHWNHSWKSFWVAQTVCFELFEKFWSKSLQFSRLVVFEVLPFFVPNSLCDLTWHYRIQDAPLDKPCIQDFSRTKGCFYSAD